METKTKLDKLERNLSDLENKLFDERCRQNEMLNNRGWGYGMRNAKIGFSTRREDYIKEQIKQLSNINS